MADDGPKGKDDTMALADIRNAFSAMRTLRADPDDLPQVFTIIEAFARLTLPRLERRMRRSESGRRILRDQPNIVALLEDREALRRLPEGSLGRAYLDFVESEKISAAGIVAADQVKRAAARTPSQRYLHERMRDTHDLWHAVTGYRGDVLGETALLAFYLPQTWNVGVAMIVAIGLLETMGKPHASRLIVDGFRRGRAAAWLPAEEWESLLALPVEEVRRRLRIGPPPAYTPVRSSELKQARAAGAAVCDSGRHLSPLFALG
jgi:ubiquinone biosynthesis protein COQ4